MADEILLPYRTDWRDLRAVLDYCKGRGVDRAALEARFGAGESLRETLNALEQLGLIERGDAGDVRLSEQGRALAYAPDAESVRARFRETLAGYRPYRIVLERALADGSELLDAPWVEHVWQVDMRLGQPRNRVEEARTCFFRLADEAGLGSYRRGVRGQTTRLELAPAAGEQLVAAFARSDAAGSGAPADERLVPAPSPGSFAGREAGAGGGSRVPPVHIATSVASGAAGPLSLSIQVDISDWELEKIEAFLRLIGYLAPAHER